MVRFASLSFASHPAFPYDWEADVLVEAKGKEYALAPPGVDIG